MKENHRAVPLSAFFEALERRLAQAFPGQWPFFRIELCGRIIELRFETQEHAANVLRGLRGRLVQTDRRPGAVFKYWVDDCARYLGPEHMGARYRICTEEGQLASAAGGGFTAEDSERRVFYCCHFLQIDEDPTAYSHVMCQSFSHWGRSEGMLMLHAAAVGVGDKGVLIAGKGGAGKSTLSAACLSVGMTYVGDDYIMLSGQGSIEAMPVYSSLNLHPDMAAQLCLNMPQLWRMENGKLILDASGYPQAERLPIRAIVVPTISDELKMTPIPAGKAVVRIAHSTAAQMPEPPDPALTRAIAARLSRLPAYAFGKSGDPRRNADFLYNFIVKEL